ncbi:MAG: hypothetical protein JWP59_373 [Massilia sp.]|jgi:uncharacterized membrane protein YuzA (DUF378 family)|nr:hypothetical protein [Massilia sp.]
MATMNIPANDRRHTAERRQTPVLGKRSTGVSVLDYLSMALMIIGGLNWASVGVWGVDVVARLFGVGTPIARVIYILVGLAALYGIYLISRMEKPGTR